MFYIKNRAVLNLWKRNVSTRTSPEYTNYVASLHKKWRFFTHPDFFTKTPDLRSVNSKNLLALQTAIDNLIAPVSSTNHIDRDRHRRDDNPRSLIFYIKEGASAEMPQTRRVKVSMKRLTESMREILEDYDVELPPPVLLVNETGSGASATFKTASSISLQDLESFLDLLLERRDLLAWRKERNAIMARLMDVLQSTLGVDAIEMRYNWSAANNAKMFKQLLAVLKEAHGKGYSVTRNQIAKRALVHYPWTGLKLVFTNDDCTSDPVNPIEGEVQLSPGHVPLQWLEAVVAVDSDVVSKAISTKKDIHRMEKEINEVLSNALINVLLHNKQFSVPAADRRAITGSVSVRIRRGFTATQAAYGYFLSEFLSNVHTILQKYIISDTLCLQKDEKEDLRERGIESTPLVFDEGSRSEVVLPTYHDATAALLNSESLWMSQLPLTQEIVVEYGHGSRLLADTGEIRVDARLQADAVMRLIEQQGLLAIKTSALQKRQRYLVKQLSDELCDTLGLSSIEMGIGVTEASFFDSLQDVRDFIHDSDGEQRKRLESMRGLSIKIGMYLGFSDDGAVILPQGVLRKSEVD
jgi:hypothetical protein